MSPFTPHKLSFAHLPTPLQPLTRLSALLGGPRLWIKRDDCTGLALGGNKVRKLEYLVADAVAQGATRLITAGPLQSNHCRQTAAAAAAIGLECELVIEDKVDEVDHLYLTNGNILLDRLLGARLRVVPRGTDVRQALSESAAQCRAAGGVPYEIAVGASSPIGALGYVNASVEIHAQAQALKVRFDHVVHASGSGGTQAGLLAGHAMLRSDTVIHGVDILGDGYAGGIEAARAGIHALASETLALIGHERGLIGESDVVLHAGYVGDGFGKVTAGMLEAVRLLGENEAILLDPVHSGKAMAGLIDFVRQGRFRKDENVLFIHTGGHPSLFAYADVWSSEAVKVAAEVAR